jgi:hypothetical protein
LSRTKTNQIENQTKSKTRARERFFSGQRARGNVKCLATKYSRGKSRPPQTVVANEMEGRRKGVEKGGEKSAKIFFFPWSLTKKILGF